MTIGRFLFAIIGTFILLGVVLNTDPRLRIDQRDARRSSILEVRADAVAEERHTRLRPALRFPGASHKPVELERESSLGPLRRYLLRRDSRHAGAGRQSCDLREQQHIPLARPSLLLVGCRQPEQDQALLWREKMTKAPKRSAV